MVSLLPPASAGQAVLTYDCLTSVAAQELREAKDSADKLQLQLVDLKTRLGADAAAGAIGDEKSPDDGRHTPLRPSKERDALNPKLAEFLRKVGRAVTARRSRNLTRILDRSSCRDPGAMYEHSASRLPM